MTHEFTSQSQERLFAAVLDELNGLGYSGSLLKENYGFSDHFTAGRATVEAPAAAFGQAPFDPNSACFAVALSNGECGPPLINRYRALGAPSALEVHDDSVTHWRVSADVTDADKQQVINRNQLASVFRRNRDRWKPSSVLRAKNITTVRQRQLDFIDAGLLPALEYHIREKLDPLLQEILSASKTDYLRRHGREPDGDRLFRLVFRALTGKVMHDRGLSPFASIHGPDDPRSLLSEVATHYNDLKPIITDLDTQKIVLDLFWRGMSFAHLSVDILAYVWENLLVSDEIRKAQGIHATPPNVARFIVQSLIDVVPASTRCIVEPCCGSGTFLVAALQRLRELMQPDMDLVERHRYFSKVLRGFDTESFGLEVSQSCLTLADFPNHNGWCLKNEDVFGSRSQSPEFTSSLETSRFVLCNPPFEVFTNEQRQRYQVSFIQPPAELLKRVLDRVPDDAEIGFVLPYQAIDGRSYSSLRRRLGERFGTLDVVHLPEGVFEKANFPTILLVARDPRLDGDKTRVAFSEAASARDFVRERKIDRIETATKTASQLERSLAVVELGELWRFLSSYPTLSSAASDIARGVEWQGFDSKRHLSKKPKPGFLPGFYTSRQMHCFEAPPLMFLNAKDDRRRNAWDKPWHLPKVVCNAVRKSQGPWKICACAVDLNLICTQNFTVLWPHVPWTSRSLSAVMNGPIACAFMASHERWKHLTKENLSELPIPTLSTDQISTLDSLVLEYMRLARLNMEDVEGDGFDLRLRELLMRIDGIVLQAYDLPHNLVDMLLDFFKEQRRPASVQYDTAVLRDVSRSSKATDLSRAEDAASWRVVERALQEDRV